MATVITQNELLEALAEANAAPAEARTVTEIVKLTGWNKIKVRDAIGRLALQNRISVHKVVRIGIDGRNARVTAYAILPPSERR